METDTETQVTPPEIQEATEPAAWTSAAQEWDADTRVLWCYTCQAHREHRKNRFIYECKTCGGTLDVEKFIKERSK
jgi:Zn finger protein HypA/HybF involved in hydrogenase expression